MQRLLGYVLVVCAVFVGLNTPALAQFDSGLTDAKDVASGAKISTEDDGVKIVESVIKTFLSFAGLIALAAVIWGGFTYITSAGDDSKAEKGKKIVLYALVGLMLIGLAAVVVNIVIDVF